MSPSLQQSLLVALTATVVAVAVAGLARKQLLTFRYAIGWMSLALIGVLSSLFLQLVEPLANSLKLSPIAIVSAVGLLLLVVICIQLSISISGLQNQVRWLAESHAIKSGDVPASKRNEVLAVVPAFNEANTVGVVVQQLHNIGLDVLVVDDGSSDATAMIARSNGASVISMPFNTGVGGAIRAGFRYAIENDYDTVVQCDADGQHPVSHVNDLLNSLELLNCDMVIGSRFASKEAPSMSVSKTRRLAMWTLASSASWATRTHMSDVTSGFRAVRGQLLRALSEHLPSYYLGDTYEAVIAAGRSGYSVREIASPIAERLHGNSSATTMQAFRLTIRAFATSVLRIHIRLPRKTIS